jgi:hypothetical protein
VLERYIDVVSKSVPGIVEPSVVEAIAQACSDRSLAERTPPDAPKFRRALFAHLGQEQFYRVHQPIVTVGRKRYVHMLNRRPRAAFQPAAKSSVRSEICQ